MGYSDQPTLYDWEKDSNTPTRRVEVSTTPDLSPQRPKSLATRRYEASDRYYSNRALRSIGGKILPSITRPRSRY
jgi:hypothetical protein